ncbi:MAG: VWA domain-containing protein [Vulcanimicrobiota bacterium]
MKPTLQLIAHRPVVANDSPTTLQLLVRIEAPLAEEVTRPDLNLALCLDRSGSMAGLPLAHAKQAATHLVERLSPSDKASLVAFGSHAQVLAGCRTMEDPGPLLTQLQAIQVDGCTALHMGWHTACRQAEHGSEPTRLNRVILLSDGQANEGLTDPDRVAAEVADWQRRGVTTTTVGLGLHYNEDLLAGMAQAGGGNFYHVQDSDQLGPFFQIELQGLARTYGRSPTLGVEALNGVELLRVYNPLDRTLEGRFKLNDLVRGCPTEVVFEFLVPACPEPLELADFRLAWTDCQSGERHHFHQRLILPVAPYGQLSEFPFQAEVMRKRAVQLAARALKKAVRMIDTKKFDRARTTVEAGLDFLAEAGSSPELDHHTQQLTRLLKNLDNGAYNEVRKQATFASISSCSSSLVLSSGVREFLALPPEERTPERLNQLMGGNPS